MKTIAFTWVYNDMISLELWASYYSRYFNELLVLCVGTKEEYNEKLEEMRQKYNLIAERLDRNEWDVPTSLGIVKDKQMELLKHHKWVLFSDPDEIVATDPEHYKDLKDFMKQCKEDWVWCLGYEILQDEGETYLDYSQPILKQRRSWMKNPYMNKVLIGKVPLSWNEGLHQIEETKGLPIVDMENKGLLLLHLKHADFDNPYKDLVLNRRAKYGYVMEKFGSRDQMPDWLKEIL